MQRELFLPEFYYKNNSIFYKMHQSVTTKNKGLLYSQYEFEIDNTIPLQNQVGDIEYTIHPHYSTFGLKVLFKIKENKYYPLEYITFLIEKTILNISVDDSQETTSHPRQNISSYYEKDYETTGISSDDYFDEDGYEDGKHYYYEKK